MKNQNKTIAIVIIAAIVLIAAYLYWPKQTPETATNSNTNTPAAAVEVTEPAAHAGLTYAQAIVKYGSRRFQFVNCVGSPGTMTVKAGQSFMIDNRDKKARTITVAGTNYRLGAEGFAIVSSKNTGTENILCDGGGAASLNVQK